MCAVDFFHLPLVGQNDNERGNEAPHASMDQFEVKSKDIFSV